jgi:hypothetical protein
VAKPKPKLLRKLRITRVDLVDRGANQDADVLLFKRDDDKSPPKEPDMKFDLTLARTHAGDDQELRKALDWIDDVHKGLASVVQKQEAEGPRDGTFNDVMARRGARKVMMRVQEFAMALDETIGRIADGKAQHDGDRKTLLKDAVESFVRAVKADLPKFVDAEMGGMSKQDRERLEDVAKLIRGGEPTMTLDPKKKKSDDKKPAADMGALRKMFAGFARLMGATDDDVIKFDPPDGVDDVWKGVSPQLRARIEATDAATKAAAAEEVTKREAAEARVAKLEEERTLAAVTAELQTYKNIGIDPTKDAGLFSKIVSGLSADEAKRMREIFKGADKTIETGKVFAELGAASLGVPTGSADEEIEKRVTAILAKAESKDLKRDDAMDQVLRDDPALYERYRKENAVRV